MDSLYAIFLNQIETFFKLIGHVFHTENIRRVYEIEREGDTFGYLCTQMCE